MSEFIPLNETASVILDGNGNGTASLGPASVREKWHPANVHVSVSSNVLEATASLYIGNSPGLSTTFRDQSYSGSSGDMCDSLVDVVYIGQQIFVVWNGGDVGALATMSVTGQREVARST